MLKTPLVQAAREKAVAYHANQMYGKHPYIVHLDEVAEIASHYVSLYFDTVTAKHVLAACYLHDILEDTTCSYEDLLHTFGPSIATWVFNVTDEQGNNRTERKLKTWHKIRSNKASIFIKLCDRLANTQAGGKKEMYIKEFPIFQAALYEPGQFTSVWTALNQATFG